MNSGKIIIACIVIGALLAVGVMVKYATDIKVEEKRRRQDDPAKLTFEYTRNMGVIALNQNHSLDMALRFPYVVAITRNYSETWSFACFASIILMRWIVTSAHCWQDGATHRALLFHDYVTNYTHTYPILFWKLHEDYDDKGLVPVNDIAVAKLNFEGKTPDITSSTIDEGPASGVVAAVWKTVTTMDKRMFLTNDFERFGVLVAPNSKCRELYGMPVDESRICADLSYYRQDCFTNEFGPIYVDDKVVGIITVTPKDCDVKHAIFTNVSFYTKWILKATKTMYYR